MKRSTYRLLVIFTLASANIIFPASSSYGLDGTWINTTSRQPWSAGGNWSGGTVADSATYTADFSTLDISGNMMVHLDTTRTIGNLVFGDTVTNSPGSWTLDNNGLAANILTLSGGTPTITVNAIGTNNFVTINGTIAGGPVTKAGTGSLKFSRAMTYTGQTTINAGTLTLDCGDHTLAVSQPIQINGGGTLDLGTNSQYTGSLSGTNGTITGSGGRLTINQAASQKFAGSITGSINLVKTGNQTLTLGNASSTTGTVSIIGGGLTLQDNCTLTATNRISVNSATLTLDNNGTANLSDRINNLSPITLNSGSINCNGRDSNSSTETLGTLTANAGASIITAAPGTGGTSASLTLTNLVRNTGATLLLQGSNLGTSSSPYGRILITGGPTNNLAPVNGVVRGVFYMVNTDNYFILGHTTDSGFGPLGTAGYPSTVNLFNTAGATDNVDSPSDGTVGANKTVNSFKYGNLTFSNGTSTGGPDLLTIASGMTMMAVNTWGSTTQRGRITSGTSELFIFKRDANVTPDPVVNSVIVDNGGPVSLVLETTHQDRGPYVILTAPNTYSGGTFVDSATGQGGIELNATTPGTVVIPAGGLTINNNSVVDMVSFQGQIDTNNVVTINGGGMLRLMGTNTLAGIVFNSNGGTTQPSVIPYNSNTLGGGNSFAAFGSKAGTLIITGDISSTPSNPTVTPLIDSGTLDLNGSTAHAITVTALPEGNLLNGVTPLVGLEISSAIQNGGFTKKGSGVLKLSYDSTYAGPLAVENGTLSVANFNNSGPGPLGTNTLAITLGGTNTTGIIEYTGGNVTCTRSFSLASGGSGGFQVDSSGATLTLSGTINGSGGLIMAGPGTLLLSGNKNYTGPTTVRGGTLSLGSFASSANITVGDSPANSTSILTVSSPLQIANDQTLAGHGTVNGDLAILSGGHLSPGGANSAGTLAISDTTLAFNDGAVLDFDIGGTDTSPVGDKVYLTGTSSTITFGSTAILNLNKLAGTRIRDPAGLTFVLFQYTGNDPALPAWTILHGNTEWAHGHVSIDSTNKRVLLSGLTLMRVGMVIRVK